MSFMSLRNSRDRTGSSCLVNDAKTGWSRFTPYVIRFLLCDRVQTGNRFASARVAPRAV